MNDRGHLSSPELDLLRVDGLASSEAEVARAHLAGCPRCQARAQELDAAAARFEQIRAPAWQAIEARAARPRLRDLMRWLVPLAAAAAAVMVMMVAAPWDRGPRVKGGPMLQVFALHQGQTRELRTGEKVVPGDRIRFAADGAGAAYLLVLSLDGRGRATAFVPFDGARSLPLAEGRQALPDSVELDDAPGPERLFAFFSREPLEAAPLRAALEKKPQADPAPGVTVLTFVLEKEVP